MSSFLAIKLLTDRVKLNTEISEKTVFFEGITVHATTPRGHVLQALFALPLQTNNEHYLIPHHRLFRASEV